MQTAMRCEHNAWNCGLVMLLAALYGCDGFSFPAPLRAKEAAEAGGADGTLSSSLGSPCRSNQDCGAGLEGEAMTCVRGSALGGDDFCAPSCTRGAAAPKGQVCTAWGALLPACHPHLSSPAADCPSRLNCYRTSLIEDQGVCLKVPVCADDRECQDPIRQTCASTVVREVTGSLFAALPLDHLHCLKRNCEALNSSCPASESCLARQYDRRVADICVPNCDANGHCPPNYSCLPTALNDQASVGLCMPGLPGIRCDPGGCIGGHCEDTGAGFDVCAVPCQSSSDCQPFNGRYDAFVCVEGAGHKHCVTPRAFHGNSCNDDESCRQDLNEFCAKWQPKGWDPPPGNCRQHCSPDGTCAARGGLQHTCLWNGDGGCYPGTQGLPCRLPSECVEGLECRGVPPEADLATRSARICTQACDGADEAARDAVCNKPRDINGGGYCASGFCRAQRSAKEPCIRSAQCQSGMCNEGTCTP